jgi:fermentation-respiration switch protein FrsA (DUF1100 family)
MAETMGRRVTPTAVTFSSGGVQLAGHLRVPDTGGERCAGVVFTGPFTGVKEQVVGTYAELLAHAGFVTLAFDHRNFGASGGEPRQHEDAPGKLADLRDAVSFLASRREVDADRIGCVGICLGGAYALRFAAFDPRVRALALVAGAYNDPRVMRDGMTADGYRDFLETLAAVEQRQFETGVVDYLPAVSDDGGEAAMGGDEPFAYYGTARAASTGWVNQVTRLSLRELVTLDAAMAAEFVSPTPLLVVHGRTDAYCPPDGAQAVYDRAGQPKQLVWLDTSNHIELYDDSRYVLPAAEHVAAWLGTHLAPR